jgi:hypothetical protein
MKFIKLKISQDTVNSIYAAPLGLAYTKGVHLNFTLQKH